MPSDTSNPATQGAEGQSVAGVLAQCIVCGTVFVDSRRRILALSPEAGQLLGVESSRVPEVSLESLPAPLLQVIEECLSSGKPSAERRLELQLRGQSEVAIQVTALPVASGGGRPGALLVLKGIIAPERLEREIRQLDRLASIGALSASVAHELRNALVAQKTFMDLLLERNKDAELTEVVRRETGRLNALASRMLKFAAANRSTFNVLHLHEILDHSLRLVEPELESRQIVLERAFGASPDLFSGDDLGLEQAFVNLFLNAAEAMAQGGRLSVTTETCANDATHSRTAHGSQLRVTVGDNGVGIALSDLERLFEPFFTTKPSGTGLGLVITRRIILEHGGTITVESRLGEGTTFEITLPAS